MLVFMSTNPENAGPILTGIARTAIAHKLGRDDEMEPHGESWLFAPGAAFVTLTVGDGILRGCVGSLQAHRPLVEDVQQNALAAAFRDTRFMPVEDKDLDGIHIEVSVLSDPESINFTSEDDALAQLRPGIDGVIFQATDSGSQATFLPQVWDDLKDPKEFMQHLRRKARVSFNYWGSDVKLWRYQVVAFHEGRQSA
jgi:AmmeMemoRadiSam system protein A